jgi:hypothetical protein
MACSLLLWKRFSNNSDPNTSKKTPGDDSCRQIMWDTPDPTIVNLPETHFRAVIYDRFTEVREFYSKIPWHPKLLFQRENSLASF